MRLQTALVLAAAMGCSGEVAGGQLQQPLVVAEGPVELVACSDLLLATDPIKPASELDYIGLYQQFWPTRPDYVAVLSDHGEVCQGAKDQDACIADLSAHLADPPRCTIDDAYCQPFVITTHGSDVQRYTKPEELARALGTVDTASEAVLIAQLYGLHVECNNLDRPSPGTLVQVTAAGWRVQSEQSSLCGGGGGHQLIEIRVDGTSPGVEGKPSRSACAGTTGG